jgi:mannose-6-phosphate isomerase-like protein (cupin superfamily)
MMIIGTPDTVPVEKATAYHGGAGPFSRRTLLDGIPGSVFKYVRDIYIPPGSFVGEHSHVADDEIFFIISGNGIMVVDDEERAVGPGSAILILSGSVHGIRNEGTEDLRLFVACAKSAPR